MEVDRAETINRTAYSPDTCVYLIRRNKHNIFPRTEICTVRVPANPRFISTYVVINSITTHKRILRNARSNAEARFNEEAFSSKFSSC